MEIARKYRWNSSGIEISEKSAQVGKEKGLNIISGNFEEYEDPAEFFNAITMWDVLEHFSRPDLAIRNASKILKPGGILALNTPDSASLPAKILGKRWHLLVPPSHLHYFNKKNLGSLLKRNGFEILYSGRIGKKFRLQTMFRTLALWQKLWLWKKISAYLENSRLGNIKLSINTRDNFFLIARKISYKS